MIPDIIDLIVDHLHDDKETLRICSLTSRQWVRSCYYHLYSRWVTSTEHLRADRERLESSKIATIVRHVTFTDHDPQGTMMRASVMEELCHFLAQLSSLDSISLSSTEIHRAKRRMVKVIRPSLASLTCFAQLEWLTLETQLFPDAHGLLRFIYSFPALRFLSLKDGRSLKELPQDIAENFRSNPGHESFSFEYLDLQYASPAVSQWILGLQPTPSVRKVICCNARHIANAILWKLGPSIDELDVRPFFGTPLEPLDISPCTNLRTLKIRCTRLWTEYDSNILASIMSVSLEEINFNTPHSVRFMLQYGWRSIAQILSSKPLPRLRRISLRCREGAVDDDILLQYCDENVRKPLRMVLPAVDVCVE